MGEAKRIFSKKMCILIGIAVVVNLGLFLYGELGGRSISDMMFAKKQYQELVERYQGMEADKAAEQVGTEFFAVRRYAKLLTAKETKEQENLSSMPGGSSQTQVSAEELMEQSDEATREMIKYHQSLTEEQQAQLELQMKELRSKLTYLAGYGESVDNVFTNAENMKKFSIFSKKDSYSYSNIIRTAKDFERVRDVEVTLDNDKAADAFVHYNLMYYIAAGLMVVIIYGLFDERENGMWQIVHNTPKGRTELAVKRLLLLVCGSFAILLLLYASTFLMSLGLYGGFSDLANPVQTLQDYGKFTYALSKGGYILRLFFLSWFVLCGLSVILWALFVVFRNRNHTLICTAVFVGIEILVYQKIEIQSIYNAFHYINVVSFLRISDLYSIYMNWGFGTYVFSVMSVVVFSLGMVSVLAAVIATVRYAGMRPETRVTWLARVFAAIHKQYQKLFAKYPVVLKEVHKLIITGKGLWAVVCVLIIAVYFSTSGQMTFTDAQKERDKMYLEHGGEDYSYIVDYVEEQQENYRKAVENMEAAAEKYERGEIDLSEYSSIVSSVYYQRAALSMIQEYQEKISYAERIKEEYDVDIWLVSDRGYEEIFGQYSSQRELILLIALVTAVMLIISECIAMEYRTGMNMIVHSAGRGRGFFMCQKIIACVLVTIGLTVAVYGIDYWNLYKIYGMPYLSAPAVSLTFLEGTSMKLVLNTTIGGWIAICFAARAAVALVTMAAAIFVSKIIGKKGNRSIMPIVLVGLIVAVCILHKVTAVL